MLRMVSDTAEIAVPCSALCLRQHVASAAETELPTESVHFLHAIQNSCESCYGPLIATRFVAADIKGKGACARQNLALRCSAGWLHLRP